MCGEPASFRSTTADVSLSKYSFGESGNLLSVGACHRRPFLSAAVRGSVRQFSTDSSRHAIGERAPNLHVTRQVAAIRSKRQEPPSCGESRENGGVFLDLDGLTAPVVWRKPFRGPREPCYADVPQLAHQRPILRQIAPTHGRPKKKRPCVADSTSSAAQRFASSWWTPKAGASATTPPT